MAWWVPSHEGSGSAEEQPNGAFSSARASSLLSTSCFFLDFFFSFFFFLRCIVNALESVTFCLAHARSSFLLLDIVGTEEIDFCR